MAPNSDRWLIKRSEIYLFDDERNVIMFGIVGKLVVTDIVYHCVRT